MRATKPERTTEAHGEPIAGADGQAGRLVKLRAQRVIEEAMEAHFCPADGSVLYTALTMDVLYDVTNLGLAFGTELTRTGIFRATEHFVRAIIRRPEVEARFAAMQSYAGEIQLARFDRSAGALLADRLIAAWAGKDTSRAASIELVDRLLAADGASSEAKRL